MIFFAAMPKSGGTFLTRKIAEYLGWKHDSLRPPGSGQTNGEICRERLVDSLDENIIIHQHTLGTDGNTPLLLAHASLIVVQTRDIFEVLLSFRRHLLGESLNWQFMTFQEPFHSMETSRQLDLVIDLAAPWMLNFYVTWERHLKNPPPSARIIPVNYSRLAENESALLSSLIQEIEGSCDEDRLKEVLTSHQGNYRKKSHPHIEDVCFSKEQRDRVLRLASYFPETDFQRLGITNSELTQFIRGERS
jgi:hypothetical protein